MSPGAAGTARGMDDFKGVDVSEVSRDLETWLPVVGYEGLYSVSDTGFVRSEKRVVVRSNGYPFPVRERVMKGSPDFYGYMMIKLPGRGTRPIHKIVMETFVGPCPTGMEVRHLDGDPANNKLSNLSYGTHTDNMYDAIKHGTFMGGYRRPWNTHCPLGHARRAPNLTATRKSWCLACARTAAWARHRGIPKSDPRWREDADRRYLQIMAGDTP